MARQDVFNLDALHYFFDRIDFPCQRDELLQAARREGASEPFIRAIEELPKHNFQNVDEVHQFLNGELDMEAIEARNNSDKH